MGSIKSFIYLKNPRKVYSGCDFEKKKNKCRLNKSWNERVHPLFVICFTKNAQGRKLQEWVYHCKTAVYQQFLSSKKLHEEEWWVKKQG